MKLNPSSSVRTALYALSVGVNAFMGVLMANNVSISVYILAGVSAFNAVVALMAGANVRPDEE